MSFKYINPGILSLFDTLPTADRTQYTGNTTENPNTGYCFYLADTTTALINIPDGTKEIWAKYSVYNDNTYIHHFRFCDASGGNITGIRVAPEYWCYFVINGTETDIGSSTMIRQVKYDVFMHIKSDATNGLYELYVNGTLVKTYTGNVMGGGDIKHYSLGSNNNSVRFNSIIVSDAKFSGLEEIIKLKVASTETDMVLQSDGSYITNAVDSQILQSFDVSDLSKVNITGITMVGNPAYKMGSTVNTLDFIEKDGDSDVTIKTTKTLGTSTSSVLFLNEKRNLSGSDLSTIKLGFKTGA